MNKAIKSLRTNVVTGILVLLPLVTTIYVFFKLFVLVDSLLPNFFHSIFPFIPIHWFPGVGALVTIIVALLTGMLTRNYIGRMIISTGNRMISTIPIINKVYVAIQQVLDAVVKSDRRLFKKAVLIEYPKKYSYAIAFMTSDKSGEIQRKTSPDIISVFIPTTPNPTSGFLLYVNRRDVVELEMGVETAMKLIMSGGVVNPDTLRRTDRLYRVSGHDSQMNWMKIFKRRPGGHSADPRD